VLTAAVNQFSSEDFIYNRQPSSLTMSIVCRHNLFINITEMQNCQSIYLISSGDKISGISIIKAVNYKLAAIRDFN
jgi:hypothetical protein